MEFIRIGTKDAYLPAIVPEIPDFKHHCISTDAANNGSFLWFEYPEQVYIVVVFAKSPALDEYAIQILYHILLPEALGVAPMKPESHLESIVSSIADLSRTTDFTILVNKILEKALSIVNADAGLLWVYDSERSELACRAFKGVASEICLTLRLKLGEGLIGKAFLSGMPKLYSSYDEMQRDIDDFSEENKKISPVVFGNHPIDYAYLIPVFVNRQIECILTIYRTRESKAFTQSDIELLNIFSELMGITMTNARSLSSLQTQLDHLKKCNDLYSKLTSLSVNNFGIPNIVRELKRILGAPVFCRQSDDERAVSKERRIR